MEMQIGDLISAIKKDGVDAAQAEAERILTEARKQAEEIVTAAEKQAEYIRAKNENEINIMKESAVVAAEHAKRDALLSFKNAVKAEYEKLLEANVSKALTPEALAKLICAAIEGEDSAQYTAEVQEVTDSLKSELAGELKNGLELRVNPDVKLGFRLAAKDGSGYFDCSDEEITEMLKPFFSELLS